MSININKTQRFQIGALDDVPALMSREEKLVLYSLIVGLRPSCYIEIGSGFGGSAMIVARAMDSISDAQPGGKIVCVDEDPSNIAPEGWKQISHRATMFKGRSPAALAEVHRRFHSYFDFALIDGDHDRESVTADVDGLLPLMMPHSYLLFHDAHHPDVEYALDALVTKYSPFLKDYGFICKGPVRDAKGDLWGGLRLLVWK